METFSIINPYTNKIIDTYPYQSLNDSIHIAKRLHNDQRQWKNTQNSEKKALIQALANYLKENKDVFATTMSTEMGKPITESKQEIEKCISCCDYYINQLPQIKKELKKNNCIKEPLGVILGIMPWNFPLWQLIRFLIPTIIAGNTCLIKPAVNTYKTARLLEMFFNNQTHSICKLCVIIESEIAELIKSNHIHGVSLTGSIKAGKVVGGITTSEIKPCILELGGSDPFIIFEDATIDRAMATAVQARFSNCGQTCIAAKRFLIAESIYEKAMKTFIDKTKQFVQFGDPTHPNTTVGPLARIDIKNILEQQLHESNLSTSMIAYKDATSNISGNYFPAMIIDGTNLTEESPLLNEEVFGPVAVCQPFTSTEDAIKKANATQFGLGASIWTKNTAIQETCISEIDCGTIAINTLVQSKFDTPFGGRKQSGIGVELGLEGVLSFTKNKSIIESD